MLSLMVCLRCLLFCNWRGIQQQANLAFVNHACFADESFVLIIPEQVSRCVLYRADKSRTLSRDEHNLNT